MKNVKKGKIDINGATVLKSVFQNAKALLVSPKTLESMGKASLEESIEVLYADRPLVNTGHLSEERPVMEHLSVDSISPETRLVAGESSNPVNRFASRIVGFDVTRETPVQSESTSIVPPSSKIPNITLGEEQPVTSYEQPIVDATQTMSTPVQPINNVVEEKKDSMGTDDFGKFANEIYTQVVTSQEPRREVVESTLQTPQEFNVQEQKEKNPDPLVGINVSIEERRSSLISKQEEIQRNFIEIVESANRKREDEIRLANEKYEEALAKAVKEAFEKSNLQTNEVLNDISRLVEQTRANGVKGQESRDLKALEDAIYSQNSQFNNYNGGMYNVR